MSSSTQPVQLPEALKTMLELQELDNRLGKWDKQRLGLQKQLEESQKEVKACQARQDELKKAAEAEKKKRGTYEQEVKVKEDEIKKHNAQLSQLTSNDQYKAKLSEIQSARKEIASIEETILGLIQNEEAIQAKYDEEAKSLAAQTSAAEAKQAEMSEQAKGFEGQVSAEQGKRAELLNHMGPDFAAVYARFHKANKGKVIARVEAERCCNCRMKISAHQINEVRKLKNICYCQSCGLILAYAEPAA
jgi:predicted  nucleic acid-binding Zn-ribbon protein